MRKIGSGGKGLWWTGSTRVQCANISYEARSRVQVGEAVYALLVLLPQKTGGGASLALSPVQLVDAASARLTRFSPSSRSLSRSHTLAAKSNTTMLTRASFHAVRASKPSLTHDKTRTLWAAAILATVGGWWYMTREPNARKEYEKVKQGMRGSSSSSSDSSSK
ncbi:Srrm1 protein [Rhodotorula toruloides ATCC 204091]|uniref:Srrm1 protein n=1 Tax=Rhodotorula toruloides TaxID=5286 RepID=A0A0K3CMI9_RHOTO|nr:Srrm1 protein [Rhodotorula toruloides ATCC 204091]PRQ71858.1 Srrm1 protein [Rhodotorula toruloides]